MKEYTLKAKEEVVASVQEKFSTAQSIVIVNYRGLTVAQVTDLRNQIRAAGAEYKVIKNTVIKRAAENLGVTGLDSMLEGPTAVAYSSADPVSAAKVINDFAKTAADKLTIKGGIYEGKAITPEVVKSLAETPSKEASIAMLLFTLNSPIASFARAIDAIRKQKEESAEVSA